MHDAPVVFLIGTARSGTTALYEFLCSHPDAAWMSNYSQRIPFTALLHPRGTDAGKHRDRRRWAARPVEGYRAFDRALRADNSGRLVPRSRRRARLLRAEVGLHRRRLRRDRAPVFVSKNTRNSRGIPTLDDLFPGARYVHLVRHPVPTVSSLLAVDFFPALATGWRVPSRTFADAITSGEDPVRLASGLWNWESSIAADDLDRVAADRFLRVRYEDLLEEPEDVLREVSDFASLEPARNPSFARRAQEFRRPSRPRDANTHLTSVVAEVCGGTARRLGYEAETDLSR